LEVRRGKPSDGGEGGSVLVGKGVQNKAVQKKRLVLWSFGKGKGGRISAKGGEDRPMRWCGFTPQFVVSVGGHRTNYGRQSKRGENSKHFNLKVPKRGRHFEVGK